MKKIFAIIILANFTLLKSQSLIPNAKMALLNGTVTNFKGKILANEIIFFANEKNKSLYKAHTDARGKFQILIPVNAVYALKYKNFTSDVEYTKMNVPADADATYKVQIKIDPPKDYILSNVYFDTGKSSLKPSSSKALNDLVEVLKLKSSMVIEIQGHTDDVGQAGDNLRLSQQRAEAVKTYLSQKGIAAKRIRAVGYGSLEPIADNSSEEGRSKNRRTSLKVISE
ncbi:MAG: OmpA family protein [Sphingobacteriaceae bacterium]|nr:OmpA family protein [Sphingobacteriaceae bacterium]